VHSVRRPVSVLTGGIWDEYLVVPFAALDRPHAGLAILGNAAGTTAHAYGRFVPATEIDGVEIDGELTDIGRRFLCTRTTGRTRTTSVVVDLAAFPGDAPPEVRACHAVSITRCGGPSPERAAAGSIICKQWQFHAAVHNLLKLHRNGGLALIPSG